MPRAVLADLEPGTMDAVRSSPQRDFFSPGTILFSTNRGTESLKITLCLDNLEQEITGQRDTTQKGRISSVFNDSEGAELMDSVLEVVRKEAEMCDMMQAFLVNILHSFFLSLSLIDVYEDQSQLGWRYWKWNGNSFDFQTERRVS